MNRAEENRTTSLLNVIAKFKLLFETVIAPKAPFSSSQDLYLEVGQAVLLQ